VLAGALLREAADVGRAPRGRVSTSHPVRSGSPSLRSVTRVRAHAYAIGPWVPSETVRRDPHEEARRCATAATVTGACVAGATTRVARPSPVSLEGCAVLSGRWSHQRVSAGMDTNDVTPTPLSTASRPSGRFPERPSATRDVQGSRPVLRMAYPLSTAHGGVVCTVTALGT
jgi:hypothetical protein